jgi:hypothetical protein
MSFEQALGLQGPAPIGQSDGTNEAVAAAKQQWPRIKNIPIKLTTGSGPGYSETYGPQETGGDGGNPYPGNWTVQLRNPGVVKDRSQWQDYIGLEALHPLYAEDKGYQDLTNQFVKSMTPDQLRASQNAYEHDKKLFGDTGEAFDKWLPRVQAQEYIRGGIFTKAIPNWVGPQGEGGYTPEQMKLLDKIKEYLGSNG